MRAFNAINKYRRANWFYRHHCRLISKLYEFRIYQAHNCFIPSCCELGEGTVFGYKGIGCVIGKKVSVGRNCMISQNVTIGGRGGHEDMPCIGDNCYIGAGAKVLGPYRHRGQRGHRRRGGDDLRRAVQHRLGRGACKVRENHSGEKGVQRLLEDRTDEPKP